MAQVKTITCTSLNYARDVVYLKKILAVKRKYLTTYDGNKFDVCIYLGCRKTLLKMARIIRKCRYAHALWTQVNDKTTKQNDKRRVSQPNPTRRLNNRVNPTGFANPGFEPNLNWTQPIFWTTGPRCILEVSFWNREFSLKPLISYITKKTSIYYSLL